MDFNIFQKTFHNFQKFLHLFHKTDIILLINFNVIVQGRDIMSKKGTVSEIARLAKVSPATVSRVINHPELVKADTVELVRAAMEQLGIENKHKSEEESKKKDIVILNVQDINNVFYDEIMNGANTSAAAHNINLIITQFPLMKASISEFINLIKSIEAVGVILLSKLDRAVLDEIAKYTTIIQCSEYNPETDYPYISINNYSSAKAATEYLIASGRNRIAFVNGPLTYNYAIERQRGFVDAMNSADVRIRSRWMINVPKMDFSIAYAMICKLFDSPIVPNAVFCSSDILAAAAIRASRYFNMKVPKDIAIVGFDNIPYASMSTPSITTVSQPNYQLGYIACEMLLEHILNPETATNSILLNTEFIVRESTTSSKF